MRLRLIAVGSRMPKWVEEGWHEYAKRLPSELALELVEIPLNTRGKNADVARFIRQEGEAMLAKVGPGSGSSPSKCMASPGVLSNWRLNLTAGASTRVR